MNSRVAKSQYTAGGNNTEKSCFTFDFLISILIIMMIIWVIVFQCRLPRPIGQPKERDQDWLLTQSFSLAQYSLCCTIFILFLLIWPKISCSNVIDFYTLYFYSFVRIKPQISKEIMILVKFVWHCNWPSQNFGLMAPLTKLMERDDGCHHGGYTTFMAPTISCLVLISHH